MTNAQQLVNAFHLQPHPEGGWFTETYRSAGQIMPGCLPALYRGARHFATGIYFLATRQNFSAFHRIAGDELWHFYTGGALLVHIIHPNGEYQLLRMGPNFEKGEQFQGMVPAGSWFASECAPGVDYSFVGCTVAPGFDFADFELANREVLSAQYPQHAELIRRLTREQSK